MYIQLTFKILGFEGFKLPGSITQGVEEKMIPLFSPYFRNIEVIPVKFAHTHSDAEKH